MSYTASMSEHYQIAESPNFLIAPDARGERPHEINLIGCQRWHPTNRRSGHLV